MKFFKKIDYLMMFAFFLNSMALIENSNDKNNLFATIALYSLIAGVVYFAIRLLEWFYPEEVENKDEP